MRSPEGYRKICFWKFLKILGKSQNSIGISMIPFITRYKGNHRNPNRILNFFQKFPKQFKFFKNVFFEKHFSSRKKKSRIFRQQFLIFIFFVDFFLHQSKIFSGIQKLCLENRTSILKIINRKIVVFCLNVTNPLL